MFDRSKKDIIRDIKKASAVYVAVHGMYRAAWAGRSRSRAIRAFCLECMSWVSPEVRSCTSLACPLYEYRLGVATDASVDSP